MTDYTDLAASYDAIYADRLSRAEDRAVARMIRPWLDDRDVLDVGCGTGLALALSHPRSYHGMDACPQMIMQARQRWRGRDRAEFFTGNADLDEPFRDAYDTIVCLWAWPYFTDPQRILRSWMRALRSRGDAIILSWDARHTPTISVDQPSLAAPIGLVASLAAHAGFDAWPLGGLSGRVRGRRVARTLPLGIASRVIQKPAEATPPQWLLRLHKPNAYTPRVRRPYDYEADPA